MKAVLTTKERDAIRLLEKLEKIWPSSLLLFGASHLLVVKPRSGGTFGECVVRSFDSIRCDGGDPDFDSDMYAKE